MKLDGLRVIITGAGSGFGKEMALQLSQKGALVAAIDINELALNALKQEDLKINTWLCDVSNNIQVEETTANIISGFGGLEVLINNAGIMKNSPLINILNKDARRHSIDLWQKIIEVNQNSVFYMTRSCVDLMIAKRCKGVIINISSISAQGNVGQTAYSASKAAIEAMSKVWAKELGRFGIRSVSIAPGFINTAGAHDAVEEKMLEHWVEKTPLRRTGEVNEIVKAVLFVIDNDFINGEVMKVNGGLII